MLKNKTNTIEKNKKSLFLHKTYCSRIHSSSILWQSTKSWVEVFFQGTPKLVAHFFKACMLFYHLFLVQVAAGSTNLIMFSRFIFIKPRQSLYLSEWCFKVVLTHSQRGRDVDVCALQLLQCDLWVSPSGCGLECIVSSHRIWGNDVSSCSTPSVKSPDRTSHLT